MQFWLLTLITYVRKIISERWRPYCTHVRRLSSKFCITFTNICGTVAISRKLSDRRLYEVFERWLLIWGNPKERNRRQISKTCVLFAPHCTFHRIFPKSSSGVVDTSVMWFLCYQYDSVFCIWTQHRSLFCKSCLLYIVYVKIRTGVECLWGGGP